MALHGFRLGGEVDGDGLGVAQEPELEGAAHVHADDLEHVTHTCDLPPVYSHNQVTAAYYITHRGKRQVYTGIEKVNIEITGENVLE